jgi:mRNA interferase MazF
LHEKSGVKVTSAIQIGRLAVVSGEILLGAIGQISSERLNRVKNHLSDWLSEK